MTDPRLGSEYLDKYITKITQEDFGLKYRLLEELGSGNEGTVNKATDLATGRIVAIKTVQKSLLRTLELIPHNGTRWTRLAREIRIHRSQHLRHADIVEFHEALHDENNVYIVMEYCRGDTLRRFLDSRRNRITQLKLLLILKQLFGAMDMLHSIGIAHGDLNASNVMLVGDKVKLIDFGWASATNMEYVTRGTSRRPIAPNPNRYVDFNAATTLITVANTRIIRSGLPGEAEVTSSLAALLRDINLSSVSAREAFNRVRRLERKLVVRAIAPR